MPFLTENRWPWGPWSAEASQETGKNENQQSWSPWYASCSPWYAIASQENKNNENRQNSQLFTPFENFSFAAGSLGETQSKAGDFVTDQSMIFQNIINENRLKNSRNIHPSSDFTSRKRNRKNRKRNRPVHQITNDTTINSPYEWRQQGRQRWNHVPVFDWSQSNLSSRSIKTKFQNSLRSGSSNERDKNPHRYQNSIRNKFSNTSTNVSPFTSESTSRANFKSRVRNLSNNSDRISTVGNVASHNILALNGSNKTAIKETKINERNTTKKKSPSSINSKNNEEDIIYLFSVDPSSEDKVILEIDLESNGVNLIPNRISKAAVNLTQKSKIDNAGEDQSIVIFEETKPAVPGVTSRKRKLRNDDNKASKRPSYMPRCSACDMCYDDVIRKSGNMYLSSSCTHVFCGFCVSKSGQLKVCPACNIKFISFRKLYM